MANAPTAAEREFALSCELFRLFLVHGIRPELRKSLSEKQREGTDGFQCSILARHLASAHVRGFAKDQQYQAEHPKGGGS